MAERWPKDWHQLIAYRCPTMGNCWADEQNYHGPMFFANAGPTKWYTLAQRWIMGFVLSGKFGMRYTVSKAFAKSTVTTLVSCKFLRLTIQSFKDSRRFMQAEWPARNSCCALFNK